MGRTQHLRSARNLTLKLSRPYIPASVADLMRSVLDSGQLLQGPEVQRFEEALADYMQTQHVIVVSSGTAAIHLSLMSMGIGPGDEVIVPAFTFPAVANTVEITGANVVFADISSEDACIDPKEIERRITSRTKAVIVVHQFGQAANLDQIIAIANGNDIPIIEDAACALGTLYNNKHAGTIGDLGCLSFHPRKLLTTGEGGAIVTNNPEIAARARQLRNHGIRFSDGINHFLAAGLNYRMTDFQAVMGQAQLPELDETIAIHRRQAEVYSKGLMAHPLIRLPAELLNRRCTYQTFHVLLDTEQRRNELRHALFERGIESNIGAHAIPCLQYYHDKYRPDLGEYPHAVEAYTRGLALPIGRHLDDSEIEYILESIMLFCANGLQ